jgi:hypothetical protein
MCARRRMDIVTHIFEKSPTVFENYLIRYNVVPDYNFNDIRYVYKMIDQHNGFDERVQQMASQTFRIYFEFFDKYYDKYLNSIYLLGYIFMLFNMEEHVLKNIYRVYMSLLYNCDTNKHGLCVDKTEFKTYEEIKTYSKDQLLYTIKAIIDENEAYFLAFLITISTYT